MKKKFQPINKEYDSSLEENFHKIWKSQTGSAAHGPVTVGSLHRSVPQIVFHHMFGRWEIDFAFPNQKIAIELQGWGTGHLSYKGVLRDAEKHNELILNGWLLLYFMSHHLKEPEHMLNTIWKALELKGVKRSTNSTTTKENGSNPLLDLARRNGIKKTTP